MKRSWIRFSLPLALALVGVGGCSFDTSGVPLVGDARPPGDGPGPVDARVVDAPPSGCEAVDTRCEGNELVTCAEVGTDPEREACPFVCGEHDGAAQCLYASNTPDAVYAQCAGASVPLTPTSGALTIVEPTEGTVEITCSAGCAGEGAVTTIAASVTGADGAGNPMAWFCFSEVRIPIGVEVAHAGDVEESLVWLVDGAVRLGGTVDLSGGGASKWTGGVGGVGGHSGRDRQSEVGVDGNGPCPGEGGTRYVASGGAGGGGGGGGGFAGTGGAGGDAPCGAEELVPLVGGSSGGTGADGACGNNNDCGWPSGGGGGALGIASRADIVVTGTLLANGGAGYGGTSSKDVEGGGGGGGAGGALLLEARTVNLGDRSDGTLALVVNGGAGGKSGAGPGGNGGAVGAIDGAAGMDATTDGHGGSGGGGGGGRIRLNTLGGEDLCAGAPVSPVGSCTSGGLAPEMTATVAAARAR